MEFPQVKRTRLDRCYDWVGPPDKISRIHPIKLRRPYNESELEKIFREHWENLNLWNHRFWTEHNILFEKRKSEFIALKTSKSGSDKPTDREMSEFYKDFLNERYSCLAAYNKYVLLNYYSCSDL